MQDFRAIFLLICGAGAVCAAAAGQTKESKNVSARAGAACAVSALEDRGAAGKGSEARPGVSSGEGESGAAAAGSAGSGASAGAGGVAAESAGLRGSAADGSSATAAANEQGRGVEGTNGAAEGGPAGARGSAAGTVAGREARLARLEVERVRAMVKMGALPASQLAVAEAKLADAQDEGILETTLYGSVNAAGLDQSGAEAMVAAAERRVERQKAEVERMDRLAAGGMVARSGVGPARNELQWRETTLDLARQRAALIGEMAEAARREMAAESAEAAGMRAASPANGGAAMERYDGDGHFDTGELKQIEGAYARRFAGPLPISAEGETAVHRALGFDHRGRVDVAVNPDAPEGQWLRRYLEANHIPYYAFRAAVPGKATGAHIHIGPGSTRLHNAD